MGVEVECLSDDCGNLIWSWVCWRVAAIHGCWSLVGLDGILLRKDFGPSFENKIKLINRNIIAI